MNPKNTWFLVTAALLLGAFIYCWETFMPGTEQTPETVLPGLDPASVERVQIRVAGEPEVLVERGEGEWRLVKPLACPARPGSVDLLLQTLGQLRTQGYLSARELIGRPNAEAEFGFENPSVSIMLFTAGGRQQLLIGDHTAPGDQVFVERVGTPGVHLVSTNLLEVVPRKPGDWRDPSLLDWKAVQFDRVQVNSGARTMELVNNPTNHGWQLARLQARADNQLVGQLFEQLRQAQVREFITDDPGAELSEYGLDKPDLEMAFSLGSNLVATLQFGGSVTNGTNLVYGRRGSGPIFTLSADELKPWRAPATELRDRRLFSIRVVPDSIEVRGIDSFVLNREPEGWRVTPGDFIADTNYMNEIIAALAQMQIVEFVKDVVTQPDLPGYGLDPASREYVLNFNGTNASKIDVLIGTNRDDVVYAKRADEPSVSAVRRVDADFLPAASWQMRNRRLWSFGENDVARVLIEKGGVKRELVRTGTNAWSLAEGSSGAINTFGVEETVHRLGDLSAAAWVAHGGIDRARYGFQDPASQITITLKDGTRNKVEFGGDAPSQFPYALVTLDGEPWVFEFPWATAQFVETYLSVPGP